MVWMLEKVPFHGAIGVQVSWRGRERESIVIGTGRFTARTGGMQASWG